MNRLFLTAILALSVSVPALAQTPTDDPDAQDTSTLGPFPAVTFGVVSFIQYSAELHESDGFNAFDVTRLHQHPGAALGPRARPVHARRAADD